MMNYYYFGSGYFNLTDLNLSDYCCLFTDYFDRNAKDYLMELLICYIVGYFLAGWMDVAAILPLLI